MYQSFVTKEGAIRTFGMRSLREIALAMVEGTDSRTPTASTSASNRKCPLEADYRCSLRQGLA
jgi:hypothetical protein